MATNRTSEAVARLAKNGFTGIPKTYSELWSIAAKYERMEEALKAIGDPRMWRDTGCGLTWEGVTTDGNEVETNNPVEISKEALAFDPLAQ